MSLIQIDLGPRKRYIPEKWKYCDPNHEINLPRITEYTPLNLATINSISFIGGGYGTGAGSGSYGMQGSAGGFGSQSTMMSGSGSGYTSFGGTGGYSQGKL